MSIGFDVLLVLTVLGALMLGYPVALTLGGVSVLFGLLGWGLGAFDGALFYAIGPRIFGIMSNSILLAIPLFVFMGLVLERSRLADEMVQAAAQVLSSARGGLTVSVTLVGMVLAASTGIVGASVVTLGLLALPSLLKNGVSPALASGSVAAAGTLGQIIPPSIVLIVLGDQMSNAWQQMQLEQGNFAPDSVSVVDLFAGALGPGLLLVTLFCLYQIVVSKPVLANAEEVPIQQLALKPLIYAFAPPLILVLTVLGSILGGVAAPSEAASVGAIGALLLAHKRLNRAIMQEVLNESVHLTAMIFLIIIGASLFALVFRGFGGDETIAQFFNHLPGGTYGAICIVMLVIFILGFFLEFIEITFIVVPLAAPILLAMPMNDGTMMSPIWLGVLIALNLQTSFLTPPFGVSLFYIKTVVPEQITTRILYQGVIPFVLLQVLALGIVMAFPRLATWLPQWLNSG